MIFRWLFESSSSKKKIYKKATYSKRKNTNSTQDISHVEEGSTSKEAKFHLRSQLFSKLFMANENLICYRTAPSSFSPSISKVPPQTLKFLLLSSSKHIGWWKAEYEVWRTWITTCLSTTSCPLCFDCASSCPQNMKFKLFSLFSSFSTTSRWCFFSTALLVL